MRLALALAAAAAVAAHPLHAQFKPKIKVPSLGAKAVEASAGNKGAAEAAPTFDDRNLEITDARLDGVIRGLQAAKVIVDQRSDERVQAARRKEDDDYRARSDRWDACNRDVQEGGRKNQEAAGADLQKRMMAAQAKGDYKELTRLTDSIQRAAMAAGADQQKQLDGKCGPKPTAPERKNADDPQAALRKEAGLTNEQWFLMRERLYVIAYAKKGDLEKGLPGFTPTESQAVLKRYGDLEKVREYILSN